MTDFSGNVAVCIADWGRRAAECNGSSECLETASKKLRHCLDKAFPDSERVNLQGDKVNYMLSSVFFLANRLVKASQGLAEFDKVISTAEELTKYAGKIRQTTKNTHSSTRNWTKYWQSTSRGNLYFTF